MIQSLNPFRKKTIAEIQFMRDQLTDTAARRLQIFNIKVPQYLDTCTDEDLKEELLENLKEFKSLMLDTSSCESEEDLEISRRWMTHLDSDIAEILNLV